MFCFLFNVLCLCSIRCVSRFNNCVFCFFVQRYEESVMRCLEVDTRWTFSHERFVCLCHVRSQEHAEIWREVCLFVSRAVCMWASRSVTSVSHYVNNVLAVSSLLFSYSHECNMIRLWLYKRFIHQAFEWEIILLFLSPTTKE